MLNNQYPQGYQPATGNQVGNYTQDHTQAWNAYYAAQQPTQTAWDFSMPQQQHLQQNSASYQVMQHQYYGQPQQQQQQQYYDPYQQQQHPSAGWQYQGAQPNQYSNSQPPSNIPQQRQQWQQQGQRQNSYNQPAQNYGQQEQQQQQQNYRSNHPRPNNNSNQINQRDRQMNDRYHASRQGNNSQSTFQSSAPAFSAESKRGPSKSTFQRVQSPLNDFGDMGAAVRKYAAADAIKNRGAPTDQGSFTSNTPARREDRNLYRKQHGLTAWDKYGNGEIPEPFQRFEDFPGLADAQLNAFYNAGFTSPTPIQAQTWPIALQERDVVSIAKTGSGKTLAFLLPAYKKIDRFSRGSRNIINALVLAPTRELATQIQEEADKFGSIAGYHSACAYGGAPKRDQMRAINSGISVLVATPGRLNDFIESNQVDLSSVFYLVLDEADRMLDMGFEPQIRSIIRCLPRKRQTLMFSATWPEEVRRLANDFLYQPIHIRLGNTEAGLQANESIQQNLILLRSGEDKDGELVSLIRSRFLQNRDLVLIFVARKNTCDFVTNMLNRCGIHAAAMHGDRDQNYRERTLAAFRDGSRPIMVATDVASRGIDVKGISAVINYDLANTTEDYVHRIGRTGRAGMVGESYTFLTHSNEDVWKAMGIVEIMEKNGQYAPPEVQEMIDRLRQRQQQNKERRDAENEQFQKVLIVAEKPSVAKMIAEHLSGGRFRTRRGQSRANQIFEFIKWFGPAQQKCKLMVTSVVGHIFGLNFENGRVRDIATLFHAKVQKVIEDTTKKLRVVEHLQELGQESDFLFLWLDCDREGENIGFEVISLTQDYIHYDNVYRARFSALTKTELVTAYDNPVRPDKYAAMCVDARQELDLKIGVAFSRLMTRAYLNLAKEKFRGLKDQKVVSYGPCQTPTLWFCVQRHKEIKNFRARKFYVVSVVVNFQGQEIELNWINERVSSDAELNRMESAVRSAQSASVIEVKEEKKTVRRPLGLNTVTLLKACSKGLGLSPTAAMSAAEHLYTSGYISYPRTETSIYPPSFDLVAALEEQANHPNSYLEILVMDREGWRIGGIPGASRPNRKTWQVGDHPPITPMIAATRNEITKNNEWRIYDYVTRHFIASLHDDMEYVEKKLLVDISGFRFHYKWHEIIEKGFIFAMPWKLKGLHLNECRIPPTDGIQGQSLQITNFNKVEDFTKPPDYLQESELIALMDEHGIGTDASIPQHIKNIQERNYVDVCGPSVDGERGQVIKVRKFFGKNSRGGGQQQQQERPTSRHMVPRGFGLAFLSCFEELDRELCEPRIRAYMEQQVSKIATGETEKEEVVSGNLKLFLDKFINFRDNMEKVDRFFAPKGQYQAGGGNPGGGFGGDGVRGRGGMGRGNQGGGRGGFPFHNNFQGGGEGGFDQGRGRGGFNQNLNQNRGDFQQQQNQDFNDFRQQNQERGGFNQRGGRGNERGGFRGRGASDRGSFRGNSRGGSNRGRGQFGRGRGTFGDDFDSQQSGIGRGSNPWPNIGQKRGNSLQGPDMPKRSRFQ